MCDGFIADVESQGRLVHFHFEETVQYSVPIHTQLSNEELGELYDSLDDEWFALIEKAHPHGAMGVDPWQTRFATLVITRLLNGIFVDEEEIPNGTQDPVHQGLHRRSGPTRD